jgi:hypothetical protein
LLGAGALVRLFLAFDTVGVEFDTVNQAALLIPSLMVYVKWGDPGVYLAMMTAVWLSILVALARLTRQVAR